MVMKNRMVQVRKTMNKVECLKNLLSCMSGKKVEDVEVDTVCEMLKKFCEFYDEEMKSNIVVKKLSTPTNNIISSSVTTFDLTSGTMKKILMEIFHAVFNEDDSVTNVLPFVTCPTGILQFSYAWVDEKEGVKQYHIRCVANNNAGLKGIIYEFLYTGDQSSSDFPLTASKKM